MDDFFTWLSKPMNPEDITIWFNMNNMITEKLELFSDFTLSLIKLIEETYLGDFGNKNETTVILSEEETINHFNWCWKKIINDFALEGINFNVEGEHLIYFKTFFFEAFYGQPNEIVRNSIFKFYLNIFDFNSQFSKSDLDMLTEIYKSLDKNLNVVYIDQ